MSSSLHLPERPAWKGLEPGTAEWVPADAPTAQRFGSLLQRDGSLMVRPTGKGLRGFYHLLSEDDGPDLFIRVVSPARAARLSEANDVATWLARGGVDTAVISTSLALPGGDLMLVQPWVEGRFAVQGPTDMAALGDGLARLHARLTLLPQSDQIRSASRLRDRMLRQRHEALAGKRLSCPHAHAVKSCLRHGSTALPGDGAQVLHGDMNLGNVLFRESTGQPVFLDFEDSLHNWHSPLVDIAMSLERFVFARCSDDAEAEGLAAVLLAAYRRGGGDMDPQPAQVVSTLRALSVRALLLLLQCQAEGHSPEDTEWEKFVMLFEQANRPYSLLGNA